MLELHSTPLQCPGSGTPTVHSRLALPAGTSMIYQSSATFDQLCEEAQCELIDKGAVYFGCLDIIGIALARSVPNLDRADGVLERNDLAQQAYLLLIEQLNRWHPQITDFRKYLYATLAPRLNKYITSIKHHGKAQIKEASLTQVDIEGEFDEDGGQQAITVEERLAFSVQPEDILGDMFVKDLLVRLPERHRHIVQAHVLEECTFDEIGQQLGVSGGVISEYYQRTIKWLRQYIADPDHCPPLQTALTKDEKVVSKAEVLRMARFFACHSCTENAAVANGYPRRVWRKTARLLRDKGYLKTKAMHGGGRQSYLTVTERECLAYLNGIL